MEGFHKAEACWGHLRILPMQGDWLVEEWVWMLETVEFRELGAGAKKGIEYE